MVLNSLNILYFPKFLLFRYIRCTTMLNIPTMKWTHCLVHTHQLEYYTIDQFEKWSQKKKCVFLSELIFGSEMVRNEDFILLLCG